MRGRAGGSLVIALATMCAGARVARAEEVGRPAETRTSWYGWQTLLADGGAIALWAVADAVDDPRLAPNASRGRAFASNALYVSGFAVYAIVPPVIHLAHGSRDKALVSAGLRLGAPLLGALVGYAIGAAIGDGPCREGNPCSVTGAGIGLGAGVGTAMIVDAVVLPWAPADRADVIRPQVALRPTPGGGCVLLSGRF
jgi:hypothetical protein